jgi:hypothetical protein
VAITNIIISRAGSVNSGVGSMAENISGEGIARGAGLDSMIIGGGAGALGAIRVPFASYFFIKAFLGLSRGARGYFEGGGPLLRGGSSFSLSFPLVFMITQVYLQNRVVKRGYKS